MTEAENGAIVWPFYVVCDTSSSMHFAPEPNPYSAMTRALVALNDFCDENVEAADIAHFGVITFSDDAQQALKLTPMNKRIAPLELKKGIFTNYQRAFEMTASILEEDLADLQDKRCHIKRPTVFFITDGWPCVTNNRTQPKSEWEPALERLQNIQAKRPGRADIAVAIVALGFNDANEEILRGVAQAPGVACIADSRSDKADELMRRLITAILNSVARSAPGDDLVFMPPEGMRCC